MAVRWLAAFLMVSISLTGRAQAASPPRFVLTQDQVARAVSRILLEKGMKVAEQQVSLLATVVATNSDPELDISSVELLSDRQSRGHSEGRSRVRLACHVPGTCLPFYTIVSWPKDKTELAMNSITSPIPVANITLIPKHEITMHSGTHATLLMEGGHAHIQLPVISLESGIAGHSIRVSSPDRKKIYVAEIVSSNVLKGSF